MNRIDAVIIRTCCYLFPVMNAFLHTFQGVTFIRLAGEFTFADLAEFRSAYQRPLAAVDSRELVIDMANVRYLDSAALGALIVLRERAATVNKKVCLCNCGGLVKEVLDIANFHKILPIRDGGSAGGVYGDKPSSDRVAAIAARTNQQ